MSATQVTGSPNITVFDSKFLADLCVGKFFIDVTPSVFINAVNPLGVKIQIKDPYGVIIRPYGPSYDITQPFTSVFEYTVPKRANVYIYGTYSIECEITDANGTKYKCTNSVKLCEFPDNVAAGMNCMSLNADCNAGRLSIVAYDPPPYNGVAVQSKTNSITVKYPTGTLAPYTTGEVNFDVKLYPGVYIVTGNICATYNFGGNSYVKYPFTIYAEKNVRCAIDLSCLWPKYELLLKDVTSGGCDVEKSSRILLEVDILLRGYELGIAAGEDPTFYIERIEELLGCSCRCLCADGTAIINNAPTTSYTIEGCGVIEQVVGLTKKYVINNYGYSLGVSGGGNVLTKGNINTNDCEKELPLILSLPNLYIDIKNRTVGDESFWAALVKQYLVAAGLDTLCLGISTQQFAAMTLKDYIQALQNKACQGGGCSGAVSGVTATKIGANVILNFTATNSSTVKVFVDGVFISEVLAASGSATLVGYADGVSHSYVIYPVCTNGSFGTVATGNFQQTACAIIAPPLLSSTNAANVTCPFSLTSLVVSTPPGISVEWHSLNNTLANSLVPNPVSVLGGTYFAFAKDASGCYSPSIAVLVTCDTGSGTVTAPQNIQVTAQVGSKLVSFHSAAYPPPANSYTLKRRLKSDPDVSGSYTTLGSTGSGITFNSGTGKWELADLSAVDNTLYVYRAISNGGSNPQTDYDYANIICPTVTSTPTDTTIPYSFTNSGGQIDKYVVELYDASGVTLVSSQTKLPAFATPITGTFTGLTAGVSYKLRLVTFIGTYSKICGLNTFTTVASDPATAVLSFTSYNQGVFTFALSAAIPSTNVVISAASANGYADAVCGGASTDTDQIAIGATLVILAGSTVGTYSSPTPMLSSIPTYKRVNSIDVNGVTKINGQTITIGGTTVTVSISTACYNNG